jgi:hypothetical protein
MSGTRAAAAAGPRIMEKKLCGWAVVVVQQEEIGSAR